jgi:hypothetical protein
MDLRLSSLHHLRSVSKCAARTWEGTCHPGIVGAEQPRGHGYRIVLWEGPAGVGQLECQAEGYSS